MGFLSVIIMVWKVRNINRHGSDSRFRKRRKVNGNYSDVRENVGVVRELR